MPTCLECGARVPDEAAQAHAEDHWPEAHLAAMEQLHDPKNYEEARRRKNALLGKGE